MNPTHTLPTGGADPTSRRVDGRPETDADRRFFDLREAGYTGWIDQDGHPVSDDEAEARTRQWSQDWAHAGRAVSTVDAVAPAVTLRAAAEYLVRHGWFQGDMFADPEQPTPPACALGAIRMVVFGTPAITAESLTDERIEAYDQAARQLADHLALFRHVGIDPVELETEDATAIVGDWNDAPDRNVAHVLAALHGAADDWDRTHPAHADYPHEPGSLYDCPACEAACYCPDFSGQCVHCALASEAVDGGSTVGGGA